MKITFIGHSYVKCEEELKRLVRQVLLSELRGDRVTFYIGGYGRFDQLCAEVCRDLKEEFLEVELVYVTPYISLSEQVKIKDYIKSGVYDSSLYPPIENTPQRFAIIKRNEWMINNSDLIIAYIDHTYGGAYRSLTYAIRRKKRIINLSKRSI